MQEWNRLCEEAGKYRYFNVLVQELEGGWHACYSFGVEEPQNIRTRFTDSEYDTWWKGYMLDVHGIDFDNMPADADAGPPATTALSWRAE